MKTLKLSLPAASKPMTAWLAALPRKGKGRSPAESDQLARSAPSQPLERYAAIVFQSLAVFRFFSFAMGMGLVFGLHPNQRTGLVLFLAVALVGLYNIVRVIWRLNPVKRSLLVDVASVGSDLVLSVGLVLLTGGLDSGFLIYSLAPILAAGLLIDARTATTAGAISALSVLGAYVAGGLGLGGFPWILSGNYLTLSLLYAAICLMTGILPFLTNLNWQRRVRTLAAESEQQRLRRDVHDNVAQTLAFLSMKMKRAEQLASQPRGQLTARDVDDIASAIERSYLAVRDYLDGTADGLSEGPLGSRLAAATEKWSRDTGLRVTTRMARGESGLPAPVEIQLLQIAREALANVAKHASPTQVWVELEYGPEQATLRVRDNGRGFSGPQPRGHGLNIMNERAAMIGASLTMSSAPGQGAEVVVVYPYAGKKVAS
jgi:signal transduction histidine kinase